MSPILPNSDAPISVLLVDDSPLALALLKKALKPASGFEVVGTAQNGAEALELIPKLNPTLICTDIHMPVMDGLELTRQIMMRYPRPILVISSTVKAEDRVGSYPALQAGAVDVFPKAIGTENLEQYGAELVARLRVLAGVKVFRRMTGATDPVPPAANRPGTREGPSWSGRIRMVVIGASTGGPVALRTLLARLPANYPAPIVCVQHISLGFLDSLVEWLGAECALRIKVAAARETPVAGAVYFPMEGTHLELGDSGMLTTSQGPAVGGHRPSITVTMKSVARYYGRNSAGILLTGMGRDGADGMQAIANAGGLTIAQDEGSCIVFGMPKVAIELQAARYIMPPDEIGEALRRLAVAGGATATG